MTTFNNFKVIESNNRVDTILNTDFVYPGIKSFAEYGDDKFCLPITINEFAERIRNFEVRDDDVILVGYPKSGTTWSSAMLWLLVNDLNYDAAKQVLQMRTPLMEYSAFINPKFVKLPNPLYDSDVIAYMDSLSSPRCLKTHLPWPLLPDQITSGTKKPKIVVVLRNPKDVCASMFHHGKQFGTYKGDNFEEFSDVFLAGRIYPGPYWKHAESFWNQRHKDYILFIRYSDMKRDLPSVIEKLAKFLQKSITKEEVERLAQYLSFESMKKNPYVNHGPLLNKREVGVGEVGDSGFIRRGEEGGYKSEMSKEVIAKFEAWIKENPLSNEISL